MTPPSWIVGQTAQYGLERSDRSANHSHLAGYQIVYRETTASEWEHAIDVGDVEEVTLDISKDNVFFGVRSVDTGGHHSPAAFPLPDSG